MSKQAKEDKATMDDEATMDDDLLKAIAKASLQSALDDKEEEEEEGMKRPGVTPSELKGVPDKKPAAVLQDHSSTTASETGSAATAAKEESMEQGTILYPRDDADEKMSDDSYLIEMIRCRSRAAGAAENEQAPPPQRGIRRAPSEASMPGAFSVGGSSEFSLATAESGQLSSRPPPLRRVVRRCPSEASLPGAFSVGGSMSSGMSLSSNSSVGSNNNHPSVTSPDDVEADWEGLVEATPALPDDALPQAEPVPNANQPKTARKSKTFRHPYCFLVVSLAVVVLATVTGLSLWKRYQPSQEDEAPPATLDSDLPEDSAPLSPSLPPQEAFALTLPEYSQEALLKPLSPQTMALNWLFSQEEHIDLSTVPRWRKIQLFALATFYYTFDGPNWPLGIDEDWLDLANNRSECDWHSSHYGAFQGSGSYGEELNENHGINSSCNDKGEFHSLYQINAADFGVRFAPGTNIPPELGLVTTLKHIHMGNNGGYNVSFVDWFPTTLYDLPSLELLSLYSYGMEGSTIPTELGLLTDLVYLDLHNTSLAGPIPSELGQLTQLKYVMLSDNDLSGAIPPQLGRATDLEVLAVGSNRLTGSLPVEILELSTLRGLDVSGCHGIVGTIPSLPNLQSLAVADTQLTGTVPGGDNLRQVNLLNLPGLYGSIPEELCRLNSGDCFHLSLAYLANVSCALEIECNPQLCGCHCGDCPSV